MSITEAFLHDDRLAEPIDESMPSRRHGAVGYKH